MQAFIFNIFCRRPKTIFFLSSASVGFLNFIVGLQFVAILIYISDALCNFMELSFEFLIKEDSWQWLSIWQTEKQFWFIVGLNGETHETA